MSEHLPFMRLFFLGISRLSVSRSPIATVRALARGLHNAGAWWCAAASVQHEELLAACLQLFTNAETSTSTGPDTSTTTEFSDCKLAGAAGGSDDARPKKKKRTRTTVDVVNNNRLDVRTCF